MKVSAFFGSCKASEKQHFAYHRASGMLDIAVLLEILLMLDYESCDQTKHKLHDFNNREYHSERFKGGLMDVSKIGLNRRFDEFSKAAPEPLWKIQYVHVRRTFNYLLIIKCAKRLVRAVQATHRIKPTPYRGNN
ncbi:hypothetical protein FIBSPDRAFT_885824 [Athelia psychrophila]|uniref:Uncharacterized protein n=1 Tax=Athelia psychrophila TaxID=1759441 RepID=A0A166RFY1_9AGAM|nr:hypothetical protein FIBSPDRAFT_885824 [Fibularhizoctonia sp. CBS 109695]